MLLLLTPQHSNHWASVYAKHRVRKTQERNTQTTWKMQHFVGNVNVIMFRICILLDILLIDLNKKIGQMRRMVNKIPRGKLLMIAEGIFQSKIRYGIALYLKPIYEVEDVKARKLSTEASKIQVIQNNARTCGSHSTLLMFRSFSLPEEKNIPVSACPSK